MSAFLEGIGLAIGKIVDYIPGRVEARRNKEDKLRREYEEILKKPSTPDNAVKLERIAKQLSAIQKVNKNR